MFASDEERNRKGVTGQVDFNSHTDAVVRVAVALVNVATPGEQQGRPYEVPVGADLMPAITEALGRGRSRPPELDRTAAKALQEWAGTLRGVFEAIDDGEMDAAAAVVNELLQHTGARPYLHRHDGESWHLHYRGTKADTATGWAAGCAAGLAVVIGSEYADRLGVCSAPRCDRVYVDTSRNGTKRFCSTGCQNRVKAAAFRARQG
jgi:predicted RNA-binding Zn ribbon-like protein